MKVYKRIGKWLGDELGLWLTKTSWYLLLWYP